LHKEDFSMTTQASQLERRHPLEALSSEEIAQAVAVLRQKGVLREAARIAYVGLAEPSREAILQDENGGEPARALRVAMVPGPEMRILEAVVRIPSLEIASLRSIENAAPPLLFEEAILAVDALKKDPRWQEAMRRRGIEDLDAVQVDPWPAGSFGLPHEEGRRLCRCVSYLRKKPDDNGYAHPIEGVVGFVDLGTSEVLEVLDTGIVPIPLEHGRYGAAANAQPLRPPLKPLEIIQREGPGFSLQGNLLKWGPWEMRVEVDAIEGLVLHQVAYTERFWEDPVGEDSIGAGGAASVGGGRRRRLVLHRASICEMAVPYGDPDPLQGWKCAFDAGEWGLGRMVASLEPGCDCLGEIRYLDAVFATEQGQPYVVPNAVCIHEEDYGILFKHVDLHSGSSEVRRSRRLVVSSIATVGNYDYGFFWYFYLDGSIQLEVKLTGILQTKAIVPGDPVTHGTLIAPQLVAPVHQHLFNARLHFALDGGPCSLLEVETLADPQSPSNTYLSAFSTHVRVLESELEARRTVDPSRNRYWKVVSSVSKNRLGQPVGYKLVPGSHPTLLPKGPSSIARRAGFARYNLWATPYDPQERRAAGDYPNQSPGEDGLERWTKANRSLVDSDLVLWYSFGVTHVPRPEDWPVMPVEYVGFLLAPLGFFDRNPALDLPPPESHCHTG
jgi:primary-amine oxidase